MYEVQKNLGTLTFLIHRCFLHMDTSLYAGLYGIVGTAIGF